MKKPMLYDVSAWGVRAIVACQPNGVIEIDWDGVERDASHSSTAVHSMPRMLLAVRNRTWTKMEQGRRDYAN